MNNYIHDLIQFCSNVNSLDHLSDKAFKIATELEFEHIAFGNRTLHPTNQSSVVLLNTYHDDWKKYYVECNLVDSDPVASHALRSAYPFIWSELKTSSSLFWDSASEFGLNIGWSKPTHHSFNSTSLLSFSRSSIELGDKELRSKLPYLLWASTIIEQKYFELSSLDNQSDISISLTSREKEVLQWSSVGKTVHEISIILGLSERTISFHINNSIKKLNTSNKTSAVAKAVTHRLI